MTTDAQCMICHRWFKRVGRQKYCSILCKKTGARLTNRKWRRDHGAEGG